MSDVRDSIGTFVQRAYRYVRRRIAERGPIGHDVELVRPERRTEFSKALIARCEADGLPFTTGGVVDERRVRFHVREGDGARVCAAIDEVSATIEAPVEHRLADDDQWSAGRLADRWRTKPFRKVDLRVIERTIDTPADHYVFSGVIEVDLWHLDSTSFRGAGYAMAPRHNDVATFLHWETLDELTGANAAGSRLDDLSSWESAPDLYGREFPIDVVYTWVNDQDPEWLAAKSRYQPIAPAGAQSRGDLKERYRNRDELRYSLRSLEMFAPFVRNIFVVTMGQVPEWLDTSHPQITMVDHTDIYTNRTALPTFNSSSIETQLHHIDGLAEHFIYFNDDVFLGAPCNWTDFFHANGAAKFFPADHTIAAADIRDHGEEYMLADRNAIRLMQKEFGFTVHLQMAHVPHVARRAVLYELEARFQNEFDACQHERFRSPNDLRPIAFMGHHYGFFTGRAVPSTIEHRYLPLWRKSMPAELDRLLRSRGALAFCVNDVGVEPAREGEVDRLVHHFLNRYFPYPSRFETSLGSGGATSHDRS